MKWLLLLVLALPLFAVESEWRFENSNFIFNSQEVLTDEPYTYDYNRFRVTGDLYDGGLNIKLIADNENIIGREYLESYEFDLGREYRQDVPFDTYGEYSGTDGLQNRFKLYRLYAEYLNGPHIVTAGLMRAAFGVGRIWTPVDFFNPLNSFSIETDEREGVYGAKYEYALSDLSVVQFVVAENRDETAKKAVRLKGYLDFADFALLAYQSEAMEFAGYEFDAKVGESDMALRSEGGIYHDKVKDKEYAKYIVGADYGFENSFTMLAEYLYNDLKAYPLAGFDVNAHKDNHYLGTSFGYQPSPLLTVSLTTIHNLDDRSAFVSPNALYSLSDEETVTLGMTAFGGDATSEFGMLPDTYYLRWDRHF